MKTESRDKSRANGACRHPECLSVNVAREFFENSDDRKKLVRVCDLLIIKSPLIIIKLLSFLIPLAPSFPSFPTFVYYIQISPKLCRFRSLFVSIFIYLFDIYSGTKYIHPIVEPRLDNVIILANVTLPFAAIVEDFDRRLLVVENTILIARKMIETIICSIGSPAATCLRGTFVPTIIVS